MDFEAADQEHGEDLFIRDDPDFSFADAPVTHHDTLFLIDNSASMLQASEVGEVPFFMALNAAVDFLRDKIVSDTKDATGIILYNSATTENHMNFAGIKVLRNLMTLDLPGIKFMQECAAKRGNFFAPAEREGLLVEALWLAHDIFLREKETGATDRSICLLTDEDNPNKLSIADQRRAVQRAKDLGQVGITIDVFPFNRRGGKFNYKIFYSQLVEVEDEAEYVGFEKLTQLRRAFRRKEFRKRTLATIPFAITPNVTIRVRVYLLSKHMTRPAPVKIHSKSNKRVKTVTKFICAKTGKELWDNELGTFMEFGKEKVKISKADTQSIKTFSKPGLQLMGFKSKAKLKDYLNLKPPYFLHPDEKAVNGSSQVIHAVLVSMMRKGKIAIARLLPRGQSIARFVALVPSTDPQGFFAIFLPYADDIRTPESLLETVNADMPPDRLVEAGSIMMKELHLTELDLENYPNPALQKFYTVLESVALEQGTPPEVQDALMPDAEGFARKANCIQEFFFQVMEDRPTKRIAKDTGPPAPVKVVKIETTGRGKRGGRRK